MSIQRQGETGRLAVLAAVLIAFVAGAIILASQLTETSATSEGPEYAISVASGEIECDVPAAEKVCVLTGGAFTISTDIIEGIADVGYIYAASYIDFGTYDPTASEDDAGPNTCSDGNENGDDGTDRLDTDCVTVDLIYKPSAPFDSPNSTNEFGVKNPDNNEGTPQPVTPYWPQLSVPLALRGIPGFPITQPPGTAQHSGLTGFIPPLPPSFHIGRLVLLEFNCSAEASSTLVQLLSHGDPLAGTSGAAFAASDVPAIQIPAKTNSITVECQPPPPATDTPVATDTPTATSTPTPTSTPPPGAIMSLDAIGDPDSLKDEPGHVECVGEKPVQCVATYWPGPVSHQQLGTFSLRVNANVIPTPGYGGFQTEVILGDLLTYVPRESCVDEVVWPGLFPDSCERTSTDPPRHEARNSSAPPFTNNTHVGPLVELDVYCTGITDNDLDVELTSTDAGSEDASTYFLKNNDDTDAPALIEPPSTPVFADVLEIDCRRAPLAMSLVVFGPDVVCDDGQPSTREDPVDHPTKCTVPFEEGTTNSFTIGVNADAIPDGYGGFQTEVYFAGLVYEERSCIDEVIWRPDSPTAFNCDAFPTELDLNLRRLQARATENGLLPLIADFSVGRLTEMNVHCQQKDQVVIGLTRYTGNSQQGGIENENGSTYHRANSTASASIRFVDAELPSIGARFLDEDGDTVKDETNNFTLLGLMRINCEAPLPDPTSTITPTATVTPAESPTSTNTPCPDGICPTATPTPTPTVTDTPTNTPTPTITDTPTITPTPAPPDSAHDTVPPGGKVTTGFGAEESDPVETSVTLPVGGKVSIVEKLIVQPDPPGYHLFGQQVNISAPAGTAQFPLIIQFLLDVSIIPEGTTAANLPLFKGGILVPNCTGPSGKASPDPCVAKRNTLTGPAEGDIQLTVHTSTASAWNFGEPTDRPRPEKPELGDVNGDTVIDPLDALWVLFQSANIAEVPFPNVADINGDGAIDPLDASLILQLTAGVLDEFPGAPSGIFWTWIGF